MSRTCTVPSVEGPQFFYVLAKVTGQKVGVRVTVTNNEKLYFTVRQFCKHPGTNQTLNTQVSELTNTLFFHMRENRDHSSIDRTVVHLTSAPFDRSTVIVVRDTCNSCPVGFFTFKADELKMVRSSRF